MKKYLLPMVLLFVILMPAAFATGDVKVNDFSASNTSGNVPLHIYFNGSVTGNVTNWQWQFKNVGTGAITHSTANVTTVHTFGKSGVYDVTLAVWGPNGKDTLTKPAYITASNSN
jgi:PKD repeat protein